MLQNRTYRHAKTGVVGEYPEAMAEMYPDLVEVPEGTKPLAYTPLDSEAVAAVLEKATKAADRSAPDTDEKD
jgi:hypothetical protein